jgi:antitoxin (DNA-binding transcriptional repressor) of toxin-antitoxin stability system
MTSCFVELAVLFLISMCPGKTDLSLDRAEFSSRKEAELITATIFEAKTNFSSLLKQAQKGEAVVITSGRSKTPVARLEAIQPTPKKRLGALETPGFVLSEQFFEPLPEESLWNGVCE